MKEPLLLIPLPAILVLLEEKKDFLFLEDLALYYTAKFLKPTLDDCYKLLLEHGNKVLNLQIEYEEEIYYPSPLADLAADILQTAQKMSSSRHKRYFRQYCNENEYTKVELEEWCSLLTAMKYLHININSSSITLNDYNQFCNTPSLGDMFSENKPYFPVIGISATIFRNYMSKIRAINSPAKRVREFMKFLMYLGIASIVGKRTYYVTSVDMVKARMFGCTNLDELTETCGKNAHIKALYDKYTTDRRYYAMLKDLMHEGLVCEIQTATRHSIALSLRIKSKLELLKTVDANRPGNRRKAQTEDSKAALQAFRQLKSQQADTSQPSR